MVGWTDVYPLGLNGDIMEINNISTTEYVYTFEIASKKLRKNRPHGCRMNRNKRHLQPV